MDSTCLTYYITQGCIRRCASDSHIQVLYSNCLETILMCIFCTPTIYKLGSCACLYLNNLETTHVHVPYYLNLETTRIHVLYSHNLKLLMYIFYTHNLGTLLMYMSYTPYSGNYSCTCSILHILETVLMHMFYTATIWKLYSCACSILPCICPIFRQSWNCAHVQLYLCRCSVPPQYENCTFVHVLCCHGQETVFMYMFFAPTIWKL